VATSLNFMLPLGALIDRFWASHLTWATPLGAIGDVGVAISRSAMATAVLCGVWLLGATLMLARLWRRIRAGNRDARAPAGQSAPDPRRNFLAHGVPVRYAGTRRPPAVEGLLRPHISLPCGIDRLLNEHELNAVVIHEVTHARRRDNLIRLIHEVGLCVLWFHPLVWVTGSRLALYRELSCDESVILRARGGDLVSALAKLADSGDAFFLRATASSFISHRLARLTAAQPQPACVAANTLLTAVFVAAALAGIAGTVAHTACCFVGKI
jgi:beta-lactamase regulating signal transducer with metallopeptidase domain